MISHIHNDSGHWGPLRHHDKTVGHLCFGQTQKEIPALNTFYGFFIEL